MSNVNSIVDKEVLDLVDTDYVQDKIQADVYITFACVRLNNRRNDTWIGDDGKPSFLITLPFQKVKKMTKEEVRELMLEKAKERLKLAA